MRATGIFETCRWKLHLPVGETQRIVFFGDVHHGSPLFCKSTWQRFVDDYRNDKNCLFVAMGDFLDLLSASERAAMVSAKLHESTRHTWEQICEKRVNDFAEEIYWMRGRLMFALEGNHHFVFKDGTTTAQRILARLNRNLPESLRASYGGDCCLCVVSAGEGETHRRSFTIAAHHGVGFGRVTGSMFNSLDQMERSIIADVYAMGDNHQRGGVPQQILFPLIGSKGRVQVEDKTVIKLRSGSFLRGYVKGKPSYVCDKMMRPANLGVCGITITPRRELQRDVGPTATRRYHLEMGVTA